uniref:Putative ribonuclease H-like domain-containing protein n=1 Tax=Tanacetum cinerariifolium TaxID=118510 RepID=A0A6L2MZP3_TANCI|nr:putative ribonuclease H-like domain-containing protein [Tanacetum cinerariifolium]
MQEELLQFQIQKVWILVDLPFGKKAIGTKWVYRNKKDEREVVVRNKACLVTQGHRQEERIGYDEVFALVAMIKAISIFLAFASYMGFIVYQMDVKSAFLYETIDDEVYVIQPPGFVDPKFPNKVNKVVKALYGLHQALRAWYATLSTFIERNRYRRGATDKTLFINQDKKDVMLVQVYVDDIIFGLTKKSWCDEFEELMKNRFQMSSMGELTFFLGLQVKQKEDDIFISQDKYVAEILKKFDFLSVKTTSIPVETQKPLVKDEEAADVDVHLYRSMIGSLMYLTASRPDIMFAGQPKLGIWYPKASSFDLEAYSNSDYAGANLDRKSTTGGCQFLAALLKGRLLEVTTAKQRLLLPSIGVNTRRCDEDSLEFTKLMVFFVQFVLRKMELELLLLKVNASVEELKTHLRIMANDDDDVYTKATPLALIPVVDYLIQHENNKSYYKIIRADVTHKLFLSFITLLKNFDREDLEALWKLVKERFETTEPKNFSDDFLLNTFKIMFEKPNVKANQMLDIVRLEFEEESEMSLELLRLVRRQLNEGYVQE